ncbi:AbgT family transporter [Synergistaceae bacterium OttesenSCG-928-D05]|nr:AbgT family transporter [Synergistaceae bacterium OttesenSCG-928-D05]
MSTENPGTTRKKFKVPHTYVILFSIVLLAAIGSYIIPPGVYDRAKDERTGRTLVDPASYHSVERTPVTPFNLFKAVPRGMVAGAQIIFCIFICGGVFMVLRETGAIDAGVSKVIMAVEGREKLMIPLLMLIFAIMGATLGLSEEVIVFIPIGVAIARAVGYDDIVAVAMMSTGAAIGFSSGVMNTFTVGVAQSIAELPLFSGIQFRLVGFALLYFAAVAYTLRYANKVKQDPKNSYLYGIEREGAEEVKDLKGIKFTGTHGLVLLIVLISFIYLGYGVLYEGFYITELTAIFLAMGVIGGLVGKVSPSNIARSFVAGCADITFGALVVGLARSILVVLQDGQIIDSIIHWLASLVSVLPGGLAAIGMFWVQSVINFFIPSGSGQAATTMPIMTPLADMIGITRQTAVMAFHYGDGFSNSIIPTSASLMGVLAMAKVPYEKWFKFIWPLMVIWTIIGSIMCFAAAVMKIGPF